MEINPKVNNAVEPGDLEQTVTGGPSQSGDVENLQVNDDVFGEVGEDGPNYRNVRLPPSNHRLPGANPRTRLAGSQHQFSC